MKNILIVLMSLSTILFSQDTKLTKGLGFAAGMISGSGFSYRQLDETRGFQITFGLMSFNDGADEDETWFSEGYTRSYNPGGWTPDTSRIYTERDWGYDGSWGNVGFMYYLPLHRAKKSTFYGMTGVSTYFTTETEYSKDYKYSILSDSTYSYGPVSDIKQTDKSTRDIFFGIGLGIEYEILENIRISVDLPMTFSRSGNITMFIPQAGVHYYFR